MHCTKKRVELKCLASEHMNSSVAKQKCKIYKPPVVGIAKTYIGLDQSCVPMLKEKKMFIRF